MCEKAGRSEIYVFVRRRGLIISYVINKASFSASVQHTVMCLRQWINHQFYVVLSKVFAFLASSVSETAALSRIAVSFWMKCAWLTTQWLSPPGLMGDGAGVSGHVIQTIFNTIWTTWYSRTYSSGWVSGTVRHNLSQWPTKDQILCVY